MSRAKEFALWYGAAAALLAVGFIRVRRPEWFLEPLLLPSALFWVLAILGAWLAFSGATKSMRERAILTFVVTAAAGFCDHVHFVLVDTGHYFPATQFANNTSWQLLVHQGVLTLDPGYIPHSYRFLPDALVGVFEWITGSFVAARSANRLLCYTLLYAFTYRFARVYLSTVGSVGVIVILVMLFPVTNAWYAGQFVDPLSHLSFVVCMWALATAKEPPIAASLIAGCLAKESIIIMAPCRAFFGKDRVQAILLAIIYTAVTFATVASVRLFVNGGTFSYSRVSGVEPGFVFTNLAQYHRWVPQYVFTIGILLPGAVLGWRLMDRPFRYTCLVVTAGVIISSAIFSYLSEVRNLVPALLMLAVINVKAVENLVRKWITLPSAGEASTLETPAWPASRAT